LLGSPLFALLVALMLLLGVPTPVHAERPATTSIVAIPLTTFGGTAEVERIEWGAQMSLALVCWMEASVVQADAPSAVSGQTMPRGTFATPPNFGRGNHAQVVFTGGDVDQLSAATVAAGAVGVVVQDGEGEFALLIVGGAPSVALDALRTTFAAQFPSGFGVIAVTVYGIGPEWADASNQLTN